MLLPLTIAHLKMLVRNRQSLFWAIAFPLIFVAVFGLFDPGGDSDRTIGVIDWAQDDLSRRLVERLDAIDFLEVEEWRDETEARAEVEKGDLSNLLIIPEGLVGEVASGRAVALTAVYDEGSVGSLRTVSTINRFLDQMNLELVGAPSLLGLQLQGVLTRPVEYYDFLLIGLVGMGVMTFSIIGIATTVAMYREQKILKRIMATPLPVRTFFSAMVMAYLVMAVVQTAIILGAGVLLFDGTVYGNYLYIGLLVVVGNLIFLSIGFVVGSVAGNVRAASGLGNAVALPMMFLSGTFFAVEDLPEGMAAVVRYLPLTPLLEAMRGVALDARPFWEFPQELGLLAGWIALSSAVAVRAFRY